MSVARRVSPPNFTSPGRRPRTVRGGMGGLAHRLAVSLLAVLAIVRWADGAEPAPPKPIQPIPPIADTPFPQDYREPFVSWPQPAGQARVAITYDATGKLWTAGPWGVQQLQEMAWQAPAGPALDGPAFSIQHTEADLWVGAWDGVYRVAEGKLVRAGLEGKPIGLVRAAGGPLYAGGPDGLWKRQRDEWVDVPGYFSRAINDVAWNADTLWIGTARGLFAWREGEARRIFRSADLASGDIRSLAVSSDGALWIGSSGGIDVFVDGKPSRRIGGAEGLPCTDVLRLRFDDQGVLWVATAEGLARYDGKTWSWRSSLRWLPSDRVLDVAVRATGPNQRTAAVATTGGLSLLKTKPMTLAEKAAHYGELVRARHVRKPGLVEMCYLQQPGDLSSYAPTDTDNDGLFTGLYVGAEAFRYAVTGDPQAAANAREGYLAMEFLQTVTDTPGFVARTVIPRDWTQMADRNRTYTPQEVAAERVENPRFKRVENRWRDSKDGQWLWKGDTSSDEITGHYFANALYYDLVAQGDAERRRVADHVRRITDYLIAGDYALRDLDGQPTLWGVWTPERMKNDPNWHSERGSNAVEMLSFLAVAHHVTGDEKYQREIARLFDEEGFDEYLLQPKLFAPSEFTYIDDQLLALSYRGLLAYDTDPKRRAVYQQSLRNWFDIVRGDHSPLYAFVYGGVMGGDFGAAGCVEYLRDSPLDMIDWTVNARNREDLRLVRLPVIDRWQTDRLLPPSERALNKWDGDPYQAFHGGDGRTESSSVHWLLPYWMGRYYKIIE